MAALSYYENLIQEKRKNTPFREFVKEIASWTNLGIYRNQGQIARYPESDRIGKLGKSSSEFESAEMEKLGREYDFSEPFFENFSRFFREAPLQPILQFGNNENADFVDSNFGSKNAYLSFVIGGGAENIAYSAFSYTNVSDIYNSFFVTTNSSNVYMSGGVNNSFNVFYSKYITSSSDMWFSTNCIGCMHCLYCDGLENQKYCIENVVYEKSVYEEKKISLLSDPRKFLDEYRKISTRPARNLASIKSKGSFLVKCSNVENAGWIVSMADSRNILVGDGVNGSDRFLDGVDVGLNSFDFYAVNAAGNSSSHLYCSTQIDGCSHIYYSYFMQNCSFCLGCIGLKNKSYCILNKQYTKEEWVLLSERIFASMEADGTLGKFFPASMNPFYLNDTLASLVYHDFSEEEALSDGFLWRCDPIRADIPEGAEVVDSRDLDQFQGFDAQGIWRIDGKILGKIILDTKGNFYRVIPMELEFLRKHPLPLPTLHWLERIKMGFQVY